MFRYVATPLASLLGVKETVRRRVTHNLTLESYYCNATKTPSQVRTLLTALIHESQIAPHYHSSNYFVFTIQSSVEKLCKQTGWTERQVQRWFRRRRNQDRPNLLKKFCEARYKHTSTLFFTCTFYSTGPFPMR